MTNVFERFALPCPPRRHCPRWTWACRRGRCRTTTPRSPPRPSRPSSRSSPTGREDACSLSGTCWTWCGGAAIEKGKDELRSNWISWHHVCLLGFVMDLRCTCRVVPLLFTLWKVTWITFKQVRLNINVWKDSHRFLMSPSPSSNVHHSLTENNFFDSLVSSLNPFSISSVAHYHRSKARLPSFIWNLKYDLWLTLARGECFD